MPRIQWYNSNHTRTRCQKRTIQEQAGKKSSGDNVSTLLRTSQ